MNIIPPNLMFITQEITELLTIKLIKTLTSNFNDKGIYNLFDNLDSLNKVFLENY